MTETKSWLRWQHLPADVAPDTALPPGVHLLLDEADSAKYRLLPWLAGTQSAPAPALLQCGAWPAGSSAYQAQVFAVPLSSYAPKQPIAQWLSEQRQRWPHWSEAAWQQHVAGFALEEHLGKSWWQLSTGTLRKVWQAAALASGAAITLIDEPDAGLDLASIRYLGQALNQLAQQLAQQAAEQPEQSSAASCARWVLVAHYASLPGMQWDEVVELPMP